jgi:hypothetical protein
MPSYKVKKYPIKRTITCRKCNTTFENTVTNKFYSHCPNCGKIKDTRDRAESNKQRTEIRKSRGLCTRCGNEKPEENRTRCRNCISISTCNNKVKRQIKLESGLCSRCGKEPLTIDVNGRLLKIGKNCQQMLNKSRAKSYHRLKQNGKCVSCYVQDAIKGMTNCERCRDDKNYAGSVRHWIWRLTTLIKMGGKCTGCGNTQLEILHIHHKELYRHGHGKDEHRLSWMKITEQLRVKNTITFSFEYYILEYSYFFISINLLNLFSSHVYKCPIQILVNYQKNIMKLEK